MNKENLLDKIADIGNESYRDNSSRTFTHDEMYEVIETCLKAFKEEAVEAVYNLSHGSCYGTREDAPLVMQKKAIKAIQQMGDNS